jgi:hypothetical protein
VSLPESHDYDDIVRWCRTEWPHLDQTFLTDSYVLLWVRIKLEAKAELPSEELTDDESVQVTEILPVIEEMIDK